MKLEIEEGERQVILLALGKLAAERPGWDWMLNNIAVKIDNVNESGRAEMFTSFKEMGTDDFRIQHLQGMVTLLQAELARTQAELDKTQLTKHMGSHWEVIRRETER